MDRLVLPGTDLRVSPVGLGVAAFGDHLVGTAADRLLGAWLDAGGALVDTAHVYCCWRPAGAGCSERELGAAVRRLGVRDRVVIATKGAHCAMAGYERPADCCRPALIRQDLDESLDRLGLDTVDLYYLHRDDGRTPVGEMVEVLNEEVARGRIRWFAASNWTVERLAAAQQYARAKGLRGFAAHQIQWSLAAPDWPVTADPAMRCVTPAARDWHAACGLPIVAYTATAGGFFGGRDPRAFATPANLARRERAVALAAELGVTPTQVALAWLRHQPVPVVPLFSTGQEAHLREAVGAVDVSLTNQQVRWLSEGEC